MFYYQKVIKVKNKTNELFSFNLFNVDFNYFIKY